MSEAVSIALILFLWTLVFAIGGAHSTALAKKAKLVDINQTEAVEIGDLLELVQSWTGKNLVVDARLKGKVQIISPRAVSPAEAYGAFLSALDMLGFSVVETKSLLKIIRKKEGLKSLAEIVKPDFIPVADKLVTRIFPLRYMDAGEAKNLLAKFVSRLSIHSLKATNTIILTDIAPNIGKAADLLSLMDRKSSQFNYRIIPLRNSDADQTLATLRKLLANAKTKHSFFTHPQLNALVAFNMSRREFDAVESLVSKLDVPLPEDFPHQDVFVLPILYNDAKKLAQNLNDLTSKRDRREAKLRIVPDEPSNTLLVSSSYRDYRSIRSVVRRLDRPRPQVFFDVDVIEVSESGSFNFLPSLLAGVGRKDGTGTKGVIGFESQKMFPFIQTGGQVSDRQQSSALASMANDLTIGVFTAPAVEIQGIGKLSPGALLNTLKRDSNTVLISSPQILSLSNEDASVSIGEVRYIPKTSTVGDTVIGNDFSKENVSLSLILNAKVSSHQQVVLKAQLDADRIISIGSDGTPLIGKRKSRQIVNLKNGQTVLISGIQNTSRLENRTSIPPFGSIPLIGFLFRGTTMLQETSHILIFLTMHVVYGAEDLRELFRKKLEQRDSGLSKFWDGKERIKF